MKPTDKQTENLPPAIDSPKQIKEKQALNQFKAQGVMAVKDGREVFSASFNWDQTDNQNIHIRLFGPMGANASQINIARNSITIKTKEKTVTHAHSEQFVKQQTGYSIPFKKLSYWLRGVPYGSTQSNTTDAKHHQINQNGWLVSYQAYTHIKGLILPTRISAIHGPLRIKLRIIKWQV